MNHVKTTLTMVALIGVLVLGSFVGWGLLTQDVPPLAEGPSSEPTCKMRTFKSGARLERDQVTVNVLNAGSVVDLAKGTLQDLVDAGFIGGDTANYTGPLSVKKVVLVDPTPSSAQVQLVAAQFRGDVRVRKPPKKDLGPGIDVIVGDNFLGLKKKAKQFVRVDKATQVCVPVETPEV